MTALRQTSDALESIHSKLHYLKNRDKQYSIPYFKLEDLNGFIQMNNNLRITYSLPKEILEELRHLMTSKESFMKNLSPAELTRLQTSYDRLINAINQNNTVKLSNDLAENSLKLEDLLKQTENEGINLRSILEQNLTGSITTNLKSLQSEGVNLEKNKLSFRTTKLNWKKDIEQSQQNLNSRNELLVLKKTKLTTKNLTLATKQQQLKQLLREQEEQLQSVQETLNSSLRCALINCQEQQIKLDLLLSKKQLMSVTYNRELTTYKNNLKDLEAQLNKKLQTKLTQFNNKKTDYQSNLNNKESSLTSDLKNYEQKLLHPLKEKIVAGLPLSQGTLKHFLTDGPSWQISNRLEDLLKVLKKELIKTGYDLPTYKRLFAYYNKGN